MNHKSMFSPLTIYKGGVEKLFSSKWYVDTDFAITCGLRSFPPFYFNLEGISTPTITGMNLVNADTLSASPLLGTMQTEVNIQHHNTDGYDFHSFMYKGNDFLSNDTPKGKYFIVMQIDGETYTTEKFVICDDPTNLLKIEWFHSEDFLLLDNTFVTYEQDFRPYFYFNTGLGKPEYKYTTIAERRNGLKFILYQTSNKTYRFSVIAPEHIADVLKSLPQKHYIKVTYEGIEYTPTDILVNVVWSDKADFCRIDLEFETDVVAISGKTKVKDFGDFSASDYNNDYHNQN